ncbi:hypothetical protein ACLKA6_001671 [Drosophila palustris]
MAQESLGNHWGFLGRVLQAHNYRAVRPLLFDPACVAPTYVKASSHPIRTAAFIIATSPTTIVADEVNAP